MPAHPRVCCQFKQTLATRLLPLIVMLCRLVCFGISKENSSDGVTVFIDWPSSKQEKKKEVIKILVWQEQLGGNLHKLEATSSTLLRPAGLEWEIYTQYCAEQKTAEEMPLPAKRQIDPGQYSLSLSQCQIWKWVKERWDCYGYLVEPCRKSFSVWNKKGSEGRVQR